MPRLCCRRIQFSVAFQCHLGFRFIKSCGIFNPYVINSDVTTKFEPDFVGGEVLKINLGIPSSSVPPSKLFLSAPPPKTSPSPVAVSFSICCELHFDQVEKIIRLFSLEALLLVKKIKAEVDTT